MRYALCDQSLPNEIKEAVSQLGYSVISLPPSPSLPKPTASHPDMLIFASDSEIIVEEEYLEENQSIFSELKKCGVEMQVANEKFEGKYPGDVILNALYINKKVFCGKTASLSIKERYETVVAKQGYARCSCCAVNENSVITADKGLCNALRKNGCDVLLISEGNIKLEPYGYGFIGGASALAKDTVIFFGNISAHPDYEAIREFIEERGKGILAFPSLELTDYGSIIFI